jgi:hypothetical protein
MTIANVGSAKDAGVNGQMITERKLDEFAG